jgi:hypothetical protein
VICGAKELIVRYGWQRGAWPPFGPAPRCLRAALYTAAGNLDCLATRTHTDALRRVSGAIYKPGSVGGITDWEFRKDTNRDVVISVLQKAIELGPTEPEIRGELWPV